MLDDGIVRVEVKDDAELEIDDLNEFYAIYRKILSTEKAPFIVIFGAFSSASKEVRDKFASQERADIKSAEALILNSLAHRMIGNFYMSILKPAHPTRIFATEEQGLAWLRAKHGVVAGKE